MNGHDTALTSLVLSHEELRVVTGRKRHTAQARALAEMGISFRVRPDGFPLVSRAHFHQALGTEMSTRKQRTTEPNWGAIDAA